MKKRTTQKVTEDSRGGDEKQFIASLGPKKPINDKNLHKMLQEEMGQEKIDGMSFYISSLFRLPCIFLHLLMKP